LMKKQIIVATGLAVLSTSAYATKSRMTALGQDDRGSLYIQDTRNIFRNAAHVNTFKNYMVTEWGTANSGTASTEAAPHAEGGFFREMGAFSYGVYFGNQIDAEEDRRNGSGYAGTASLLGTGALEQDNNIDLFFGGDMGIQWGANLSYAKGNDEDSSDADKKREHSSMSLSLGMIMGDIDAYASMRLKDESNGNGGTAAGSANDKWEAGGMLLGAGYNLGDLRVFAEYEKRDHEFTRNSDGKKNESDQTTLTVGAAKTHEVSSSARVIYALSYESVKSEDKDAVTPTNNKEKTETELKLNVGMEADANSWLTLRGSVSGPVIINETETNNKGATTPFTTKSTDTNQVVVNAGATLNFGKLKIDGSIGTSDGTRNGAVNNKDGVLTTDNLLTRVGVHYWF